MLVHRTRKEEESEREKKERKEGGLRDGSHGNFEVFILCFDRDDRPLGTVRTICTKQAEEEENKHLTFFSSLSLFFPSSVSSVLPLRTSSSASPGLKLSASPTPHWLGYAMCRERIKERHVLPGHEPREARTEEKEGGEGSPPAHDDEDRQRAGTQREKDRGGLGSAA